MVLNGYAFGMIFFNLNATAALTLGAIISGLSIAVVTLILKAHGVKQNRPILSFSLQ